MNYRKGKQMKERFAAHEPYPKLRNLTSREWIRIRRECKKKKPNPYTQLPSLPSHEPIGLTIPLPVLDWLNKVKHIQFMILNYLLKEPSWTSLQCLMIVKPEPEPSFSNLLNLSRYDLIHSILHLWIHLLFRKSRRNRKPEPEHESKFLAAHEPILIQWKKGKSRRNKNDPDPLYSITWPEREPIYKERRERNEVEVLDQKGY